jgi:hypothetical protein
MIRFADYDDSAYTLAHRTSVAHRLSQRLHSASFTSMLVVWVSMLRDIKGNDSPSSQHLFLDDLLCIVP